MAELPDDGLDGDEAVERSNYIEAGTYNVEVINSNLKNKEETGLIQLGLQLQVLDGARAKQTFWLSFNYSNPNNAQNQDISRDQLRLIAKAAGIGLFKDTEALHNQPFSISVKVVEKGGYTNNSMTNAKAYVQPTGEAPPKAPAKTASKPATTGAKEPATTGDKTKQGGKVWTPPKK